MTSAIMASPAGREGGRGSCRDKVRKRGQKTSGSRLSATRERLLYQTCDREQRKGTTCGRPERLKRTSKAVKSARRF